MTNIFSLELLSAVQMAAADHAAIDSGIAGFTLMQNAGAAVAADVAKYFKTRKALVLCGPGNNGGDGFIAARALKDLGWSVRVVSLLAVDEIEGDAARAAGEWAGPALEFGDVETASDEVVVDAVFGSGFRGALPDPVVVLFDKIRASRSPVVAVDIPSGVSGDTGSADKKVLHASLTVTFFRKKVGHVLLPGAAFCGGITVHDIGITASVLTQTRFESLENGPALWSARLYRPSPFDHKYAKGHAIVLGGAQMTGAALLAAHAAMRAQAGMCTIVGPAEAADVYRSYLPSLIFEPYEKLSLFAAAVQKDKNRNAVLMGPGAGKEESEALREAVFNVCALGKEKACVLDADALNVFQFQRDKLIDALHGNCVLTPHEGEFARLFPELDGTKLQKAKEAASLSGAVVVLKGADTVVATPDGRSAVNTNAPPWLATAGSGDVLSGLILGFLAQGMPPFEAACAGVWVLGDAASRFGPGLMSSDMPDMIPSVLRELQ